MPGVVECQHLSSRGLLTFLQRLYLVVPPELSGISSKNTPRIGKVLPFDCKLRRVKYLNNVIEQDHRAIRRRWRAAQCFRSFNTAERTLEGVEALHMMRKGQVKRISGEDGVWQVKFAESLFCVAA
jgi:DDE domain